MSTNLLDPARIGKAWNPKVACAVTLTLVFLCGGLAGAIADHQFHSRQRVSPFDTPQGKAAYFEKMKADLNLTPEQSEQIQSTLNDFWQYYRTVLSEARQRIDVVLTPEQRRKFDQILQEQRK